MKHFILFLFAACMHLTAHAQSSVDKWIKGIIKDMKEMNSLAGYSSTELPEDATVNMFMVEEVKDLQVTDNTFSMLINSGNGKYCNKVTFTYIKKDENYYLVFSEPHMEEVFGNQKIWINPWTEAIKLCK